MAILHFDICVVGNELSGLITGALLAQKGYRVALFNNYADDKKKKLNGLALPPCPSIISAPVGPLQDVIDRLELRTEMNNAFSKKLVFGVCRLPDFRLTLSRSGLAGQKEISQVFPDNYKQICDELNSFSRIRQSSLFEPICNDLSASSWSLKNLSKRFFAGKNQKPVLDGFSRLSATAFSPNLEAFGSLLHYDSLPQSSMTKFFSLNLFSRGLLLPSNGRHLATDALRQLFLDSFLRHNGQLIADPVIEISANSTQANLISTRGNQIFYPKVIIDATVNGELSALLRASILKTKYQGAETFPSLKAGVATLRKLVPIKQLPAQIPRITAIVGEIRGCVFQAALEIVSTPDPELAVVLLAVQFEGSMIGRNEIKDIYTSILAASGDFWRDTDYEEGHLAASCWPRFDYPQNEEQVMRSVFTPAANIFHVGRDVLPAFGVEGEAASAVAAANLSAKRLAQKHLFYFTAR